VEYFKLYRFYLNLNNNVGSILSLLSVNNSTQYCYLLYITTVMFDNMITKGEISGDICVK
jgi:hypothetical protein